MTVTDQPATTDVSSSLWRLLHHLTVDAGRWQGLLELLYGPGLAVDRAARIADLWQRGELGVRIDWVEERNLPGARAAVSDTGDRLLLNSDRLADQPLAAQLGSAVEVLGLWLDHNLRQGLATSDATSDAGLAFATAVATLFPTELVPRPGGEQQIRMLARSAEATGPANLAAQPIVDQVIWSQGFGKRIEGNWNIGEQLGMANQTSYRAFVGIARAADAKTYDKFYGKTFEGIKTFKRFNTGDIGGKALEFYANGSLGIGSAADRNKNATIKAGLELETGYSLGDIEWNLPLTANIRLATQSNRLKLDIQSEFTDGFVNYASPYLYLYLNGVLQSDAAVYLDAKAGVKGETFFYDFDDSTKINEKLDLSSQLNHRFVDIDTRRQEQMIDWIAGKRVFQTGAISGGRGSDIVKLGDFFNAGIGLPNFKDINFHRILDSSGLSGLISIPSFLQTEGSAVKFSDNLVYTVRNKTKLLDVSFDLDSFISKFLPYPISFKDSDSFRILGKKFGYDATLSLIDIEPTLQLNLGYQIDFGIGQMAPQIQVESAGDRWKELDYTNLFSALDLSTEAGRVAAVNRVNNLDVNQNNCVDLRAVFDPEVFINARLYVEPVVKVVAGVGEYAFALNTPFGDKKIGGQNNYLLDLPDLNLFKDQELDFLHKSFTAKLSTLIDMSWAAIPLSLPIDSISKILGVNLYNGSEGPDFFAGSSESDIVNLNGGADVAMLSPGLDRINGGNAPAYTDSQRDKFGYVDIFGMPVYSSSQQFVGDTFIIDSDILRSPGSKKSVQLQSGYDEDHRPVFSLIIDSSAQEYSRLDGVENLVLADELQASQQGLSLDFRAMAWPRAFITLRADSAPSSYSAQAPLPTNNLTGTNGHDTLLVPIGFNRTGPYRLGQGDDEVIIGRETHAGEFVGGWSEEGNTSAGNLYWINPYAHYSDSPVEQRKIWKIIADNIQYKDEIDLGPGSNSVEFDSFSNFYQPYYAQIQSVNPGGMNAFKGFLGENHRLGIKNLGGSVDLSELDLRGSIYAVLSAGGNQLDLSRASATSSSSDITLLLDSEALKRKLNLPVLDEIVIEIFDADVIYKSGGTAIRDTIMVNPESDRHQYLLFARSDELAAAWDGLTKIDANNQPLPQSKYGLASPGQQTFIVSQNTIPGRILQLRGRSQQQVDAYTKVIIKETKELFYLGVHKTDVFDEVVVEDASSPGFFWSVMGRIGVLRLESKTGGLRATYGDNDNLSESKLYNYSVIFTEKADQIIDSAFKDLTFVWANDWHSTDGPLPNFVLDDLADYRAPVSRFMIERPEDFEGWYSPFQTYHLGAGDDHFVSHAHLYEWMYPGAGNNIIISPALSDELTLADPIQGEPIRISRASLLRQGDVVVYTDGSSKDYIITRQDNSVKVVKPDKTVDYLFGIALIKFETADVATCVVPAAKSNPSVGPLTDLFGHDVRNRLFVNSTVDENGAVAHQFLNNGYACDRVFLDRDIVYQPGSVPLVNAFELPAGTKKFTLSKNILLRNFADADISQKKLYTRQNLKIANLRLFQQGSLQAFKPRQNSDGTWRVELPSPLSAEALSFVMSYEILEPEGYRHYTEMHLGLAKAGVSDPSLKATVENHSLPSEVAINFKRLSRLTGAQPLLENAKKFLERYQFPSAGDSGFMNINDPNTLFLDYAFKAGDAGIKVVKVRLLREVVADAFLVVNPKARAAFDFTYRPKTGLGAELIDSNHNGLVDALRIHLRDGALGDTDGSVNGEIRNNGVLAQATPVINLALSPAAVSEDGKSNLIYTFSRTGSTTSALTIRYAVGGTATLGRDYTGIRASGASKTIRFEAGAATATVAVNPRADRTVESDEIVALTILEGNGYSFGSKVAAVGTIRNDDVASLTALTLAPDQSSLRLLGNGRIQGIGNALANILIGNSNDNQLVGLGGKDIMTGGGAEDQDVFSFVHLRDSSLLEPGTGSVDHFDEITDFNRHDRIAAPVSVAADLLTASLGKATSMTAASIAHLLTTSLFPAHSATAFTTDAYLGTFIAMNDRRAGFQPGSDALVFLQNYMIGAENVVQLI
ncbi:MAG: bluetail domain-containing putative surface protein [Cyanobacteriota bacterium]|nr:bluetail domain-containing putative surface protein [Cyanobacteriota bacterium]